MKNKEVGWCRTMHIFLIRCCLGGGLATTFFFFLSLLGQICATWPCIREARKWEPIDNRSVTKREFEASSYQITGWRVLLHLLKPAGFVRSLCTWKERLYLLREERFGAIKQKNRTQHGNGSARDVASPGQHSNSPVFSPPARQVAF